MELSPGYKRTELGVIPDEWEVVPLGELMEFRNGVNADKHAYGRGIPFINVLEVITKTHLRKTDIPGRVSLSKVAANSYAVRKGDLLFNRTSETQEEVGLSSVYLDDEPVVFGGFVIRGRVTREFDPSYSGYAFRSARVRAQIIARGQGAIRANVGQGDLRQVLAAVPPVPEQRLIAKAIGDVDVLIGGLDALLSKKLDLKQAAMQELLSGRRRLPEFSAGEGRRKRTELGAVPDEWDVTTLEQGVKLLSGQHVLAHHCNSDGRGIPYLTGPADFPDGVIRNTKFTERPTTLCRKGDILVTVKGSGAGTMVVADGEYCISRQLMAIRITRWNVSFVYSSLLHSSRLMEAATAGLIPGLSRRDILNQLLAIPPLPEQAAIATVLSDMDAEIAALEARRDKTRDLKQGMMQELLTGRVRLV